MLKEKIAKFKERVAKFKCKHGWHSWVYWELQCPAPNHNFNARTFPGRVCTECHCREFHVHGKTFLNAQAFNKLRLRIR